MSLEQTRGPFGQPLQVLHLETRLEGLVVVDLILSRTDSINSCASSIWPDSMLCLI